MGFSKKSFVFVIFFLFSISFAAMAQTPSRAATQPLVLNDMSQRTGETITINSMSFQQWYYGGYEFVRELGCPLAPTTAPTAGSWQRFEFTYSGFVYIYLVSENLESLILCDEPELPTATSATSTPIATQVSPTQALPTSTIPNSGGQLGGGEADPFAACALSPRLTVGGRGSVTPGDPNWVHEFPNRTSSKIGEIPGGGVFKVLQDPVCDAESGMVYWMVEYNHLFGWTSEGLNGDYWLQPEATWFNVDTIQSANVPVWTNNISGDDDHIINISSTSKTVGIATSNNVYVYRTDGQLVSQIVTENPVTALAITRTAGLYFGTEIGQVSYLPFSAAAIATEFSHESAILDILVSEDESLVVVAEENGTISFWASNDNGVPLRTMQFGNDLGSIEFSSDQSILIIRDVDDYLIDALTTR